MSNLDPLVSKIPPLIPGAVSVAASAPPLAFGDCPEDLQPIRNPIEAVEAIMRQPRRVLYQLRQPGCGRLILSMLCQALLSSLVYGVIVGSFSAGTQLWAAPVKIAGGLMITALICLPSLYLLGCLAGSQARLAEMCGMVVGLLLLMTSLLIGFAPVAWLFSQSTDSVAWMGALHLAFWLLSAFFGLRFLAAGFSHTKARSQAGLNTWIILFLLVGVQMTTALRPLLGKSTQFLPKERKFFLSHWSDCLKAAETSETAH